jgi:hypothetical protein
LAQDAGSGGRNEHVHGIVPIERIGPVLTALSSGSAVDMTQGWQLA